MNHPWMNVEVCPDHGERVPNAEPLPFMDGCQGCADEQARITEALESLGVNANDISAQLAQRGFDPLVLSVSIRLEELLGWLFRDRMRTDYDYRAVTRGIREMSAILDHLEAQEKKPTLHVPNGGAGLKRA